MFSRATAPAELSYPAVIDAAFSPELIEEGLNSDIIEVDNETVVVVRVAEHLPQRTQTLEEVRDAIVSTVQVQKSQDAAKSWANDLLAKVRAGESIEAELAEKSVAWETTEALARNASSVSRAVADTLFKLAPEGDNNVDVASSVNGDVSLVQLIAVNAAPALEEDLAGGLKQQLASMYGQRLYQQYIDALRADADVTVTSQL